MINSRINRELTTYIYIYVHVVLVRGNVFNRRDKQDLPSVAANNGWQETKGNNQALRQVAEAARRPRSLVYVTRVKRNISA